MPLPELIGRYRPVRRLGSGGFAVVWLAHDESLDAEVAVKVMADNWADRMDLRERFLREARMLRQASSYRIVQVFDIGELEDGRPYLVMEYADRGTLADRVKANGAYSLAEALRITAEVARGVSELHAAGVVHRDLKPSNVLITSVRGGGERLLVADLGVAKSLAHGSGVTMSVGSAGYMAPEQMEPQIGVDVRADVYSLGAFAFYLMTAQRPYLPLVMAEKMPPDLPRPVLETLLSALERDRERRWPDAASLAERFDELAAHVDQDLTVAAPGTSSTPVSVAGPTTPVSPTPGWSFAGPAALEEAQTSGARNEQPSYGGPAGQFGPSTPEVQPAYAQAQTSYPQYQDAPQQYPGGYPQPQPPGYQPAPPADGRAGSHGRGRWIATMVGVVVLAAATGIGAVLAWQASHSDGELTARDADNRISLTVPDAFGPELVDSGWDPTSIGLRGDRTSGLLLADQVRQWTNLDSPVNGVFVGLSTSKQLPTRVAAINHDSCEAAGSQKYTSATWTGTIKSWTNCSGTGRTVQEVALTPVARTGGSYVYLQIRQAGSTDYTPKQLIDGLKVSS